MCLTAPHTRRFRGQQHHDVAASLTIWSWKLLIRMDYNSLAASTAAQNNTVHTRKRNKWKPSLLLVGCFNENWCLFYLQNCDGQLRVFLVKNVQFKYTKLLSKQSRLSSILLSSSHLEIWTHSEKNILFLFSFFFNSNLSLWLLLCKPSLLHIICTTQPLSSFISGDKLDIEFLCSNIFFQFLSFTSWHHFSFFFRETLIWRDVKSVIR